MEFRKANIMFNKNGNGFSTTRISLPVTWVKKLNLSEENRQVLISLEKNKILIRKVEKEMLLIKEKNYKYMEGNIADFKLENDVLLFETDWNGELYINGWNDKESKNTEFLYKPVYKFELDGIDISDIEENTNEWYELTQIVGFEEL